MASAKCDLKDESMSKHSLGVSKAKTYHYWAYKRPLVRKNNHILFKKCYYKLHENASCLTFTLQIMTSKTKLETYILDSKED